MKTNRVGKALSIAKGKKHSLSNNPTQSSKRIIGITDLRNDNSISFTDDSKGTELFPEDIAIAWDGANAGTIGYGLKGYAGSTIARLRCTGKIKYHTPFLGIFLKSKFYFLRKTTTGATIPHINRNALESIKIPPINYDDQIRIATILSRAKKLIAKRKESIKLLDEFLKSTFLEMFGDPVRNEKRWETSNSR